MGSLAVTLSARVGAGSGGWPTSLGGRRGCGLRRIWPALPLCAHAGAGAGGTVRTRAKTGAQVRIILAADGLTFLGTDPARYFRLACDGPEPVTEAEAALLAAGVPARLLPAALATVASRALPLSQRGVPAGG